jgi:hypothetical protein
MSIWVIATDLAIWTLIVGPLAVFAWFLLEVWRLVKAEASESERDDSRGGPGD